MCSFLIVKEKKIRLCTWLWESNSFVFVTSPTSFFIAALTDSLNSWAGWQTPEQGPAGCQLLWNPLASHYWFTNCCWTLPQPVMKQLNWKQNPELSFFFFFNFLWWFSAAVRLEKWKLISSVSPLAAGCVSAWLSLCRCHFFSYHILGSFSVYM